MNTDILKSSASNNREIDTDSLKIYGNCLEFKDTVIQLSNVSLVANNPIAPPQFPIWAAVAIIVGLLFLFVDIGIIKVVGIFLSLGGGCVAYVWHLRSERDKSLKRLVIATNSGQTFFILFNQSAFLNKVINALKEIIAHPGHHSDIIINIKDNTIAAGGSVIDTVNEFNSIGGRH